MNLPKHVILADCVADPGKRANHIYYPKTDEVFHVSPELAASILKMQAKPAVKGKAAAPAVETEGIEAANHDATETTETAGETGMTLSEEGEDSNKVTVENSRAELLEMAEALDLPVPEGISDADLMTLVETAVQK